MSKKQGEKAPLTEGGPASGSDPEPFEVTERQRELLDHATALIADGLIRDCIRTVAAEDPHWDEDEILQFAVITRTLVPEFRVLVHPVLWKVAGQLVLDIIMEIHRTLQGSYAVGEPPEIEIGNEGQYRNWVLFTWALHEQH